jgi:hypothetical protein
MPMHLIPLRLNEMPRDRDLVLYCRSGARSYQACAYMMQQGYHRVLNLRGGIIAWARHGCRSSLPRLLSPAKHRFRRSDGSLAFYEVVSPINREFLFLLKF